MRQALNHSYRFPQRAESVRTLCIRLPKVVLFLFLLLGAARAVELDGNNATLLDTYAWVLFRLGRLQEARRTMQQAISFDRSENPELYLHYGDILAALGEKFMAETYWRKALEKGYDDPRAIEERIRQLKSKP